jgi:exonuclease VII large subunit
MLAKNLQFFTHNSIKEKKVKIDNYFLRLDNLSVQKVLKRGFTIVRDAKDKKIVKTSNVNKEHLINIEFYDGILTAKTQKK